MTAVPQLERTRSRAANTPVRAVRADAGMARSSAVLAIGAAVVGVLSYACTVLMAQLLPTADYIDYSAAQSLLTSVGVAASALIPLPLSQIIRAQPPRSAARRRGMAFALCVSAMAGLAAAVVLTAVMVLVTSPPVAMIVGLAAMALFVIMPTWGWLQGEQRFGRYAAVSVLEVGLRLLFSAAAAIAGWGAQGALAGYLVGAVVVAAGGLLWARGDFAWQPGVVFDRDRWADTAGIAAVQLTVSMLVGADIVYVAVVGGQGSAGVAGYQAVATLAKAPVYVAAGAVLVSFPLLRTAVPARVSAILRQALRSFSMLALPAAIAVATVPAGLALLVLPRQYAAALTMLPWLALAGVGYGTMTVLAITLVALRAHRRSLAGLMVAAAAMVGGLTIGWSIAGTTGVAVGSAVASLVAACTLAILARHALPGGIAAMLARIGIGVLVFLAVLVLTRSIPLLWLGIALLGGIAAFRAAGHQPGRHARTRNHTVVPSELSTTEPSDGICAGGTPRVLHLGFEDPAAPGAGGGSLRTHEINRRLAAAGAQVTVLTTRYPGCVDRTSDGVTYLHIGPGHGRNRLTRLGGYLVGLPRAVREHAADVVVEDFFAPISTVAAPMWAGRPTIGMVQWLNARDKARQYKLPLHLVERFGVRRHYHLIAVSQGIADNLRAINPSVSVEVIGNGVEPKAFASTPRIGTDVVFVGRLETAQKGLDLLLDAWALAAPQVQGQLVIAGTGPDEQRLRQQAATLGLTNRVCFVGWTADQAKYDLLAGARIVVVPSRFETFGIVALEALATGTPVVAFDIPCLREIIPEGCGRRVTPYDVTAFAAAITNLYHDIDALDAAVAPARAFASHYNWDALAARQLRVYTDLLGSGNSRDPLELQLANLGQARARRHGSRRRLAIFGNVGNGNTGDETLMTTALSHVGDATVTLLSRDPVRASVDHQVAARPLTALGVAGALWRADGILVVGGGMFGPGLPPLVRLLPTVLALCRALGTDTAYAAIGIYPGTPTGTLRRLRRAAQASTITIRDQLSGQQLAPASAPCVGDLATRLHPAPPDDAHAAIRAAGIALGTPLLLLAPKAGTTPQHTEQLLDWSAHAARHWHHHGGNVAAIAFSDRADHGRPADHTDAHLTEIIARRADLPIPVLGPNLAPALALAVIGKATAVLGLRYHAIVFAHLVGTAATAPPWEPKTAALLTEHHITPITDTPNLLAWLDMQAPQRLESTP